MSTTVLPFTITISTTIIDDTIFYQTLKKNIFDDNYNLVYRWHNSTKIQLFDFLVYTCLGLFESYDFVKDIKREIN